MVIMEEDLLVHRRAHHPHVSVYGSMLLVIYDRHCGLIHLDIIGGKNQLFEPVLKWSKQIGSILKPIVHRWWRKIDSHLLHHLYLSVKRQVVHILVYHQFSQE